MPWVSPVERPRFAAWAQWRKLNADREYATESQWAAYLREYSDFPWDDDI